MDGHPLDDAGDVVRADEHARARQDARVQAAHLAEADAPVAVEADDHHAHFVHVSGGHHPQVYLAGPAPDG